MIRRAQTYPRVLVLVAAALLILAGLAWVAIGPALARRSLARNREARAAAHRHEQDRQRAGDETLLLELQLRMLGRWADIARGLAAGLPAELEEGATSWIERRLHEETEAARTRARELAALRQRERTGAGPPGRTEVESEVGDASILAALLLLAVSLLALTLLSVGLHRRLVQRPLRLLAGVMEEVAGGGERRITPGGDRFVRDVLAGFNRMVDALALVRRELEERVDVKTAALARALDEQRQLNDRLRAVLRELEEAQERLVRQQKMAALGTLAGGVAHEFNNLLGGIRGCAEDLLEEISDSEQRKSLEVIERATRRGKSIVDGLLRFSRSAAREPHMLDLPAAVADVLRLCSRSASERRITLESDLDPGIRVHADPAEIHQVVLNLVTNAIQASREGSSVHVAVARHDARARISVSDCGPGISAAIAPHVFEPFFTTREREGGTGLGLAIAHGIVHGLGGDLAFRDRPEGGTIFEVELPLASEAPDDVPNA